MAVPGWVGERQGKSLFACCLLTGVLAISLGLTGCQQRPTTARPNLPPPSLKELQNQSLTVVESVPVPEGMVAVFFSRKTPNQSLLLHPVLRKVVQYDDPLTTALSQLLAGPTPEEKAAGVYTEIPAQTKLLGLDRQSDGKIRINLSKDFLSGGGSTSIQQRLAELRYTVRRVEKEKPVFLDIEGQELKVLGGEGLEVQEPINRESAADATG
jgi:spore germination protein GerM